MREVDPICYSRNENQGPDTLRIYRVLGFLHGGTQEFRADLADWQAFRHSRINIMVATDAYGQGIDKPDIDFILHWEPPVNIETQLVSSSIWVSILRASELESHPHAGTPKDCA